MNERFQRQSFLGPNSDEILEHCRVGVIGMGGGGSHIVQQLGHIGIGQLVVVDNDRVEESNLNRLVGATATDAKKGRLKVDVARRVIKGINPKARIKTIPKLWQTSGEDLRVCDVIIGCLDTFSARAELEAMARRFLIPYIDIGMDVHTVETRFVISGQVILSIPGHPCLRCVGFLNDYLLAQEAQRYGAAGARPQVVWPNGVLASLAVGILMQLLTPWHGEHRTIEYLEFDGNQNIVVRSNRLAHLQTDRCPHFEDGDNLGDPFFGVACEKNALLCDA